MIRGLAVPLAAATLIGSMPAGAQQFPFGTILQQLVPGQQQQQQQQDTSRQAPPVNRMQGGQPPAANALGTDAVAVIEAIDGAPQAGVQFMDYVFAGQTVALGQRGKVTLSHLSGCLAEEIVGGTVTVAADGSRVSGGRLQARTAPNCRPPTPIVAASATEAGTAVNRVTPFTGRGWEERVIKRPQPVFKWEPVGRPVTVRVVYMDKAPAEVVWQVVANGAHAEYARGGAPLATGMPYRVEVWDGQALLRAAAFSVDPGLDVPDTLANRVVPVGSP
jgi:hypothetical protein